jgi:hypothetical protein
MAVHLVKVKLELVTHWKYTQTYTHTQGATINNYLQSTPRIVANREREPYSMTKQAILTTNKTHL